MNKSKITIVIAPANDLEVAIEKSIYCPKDYVYFVPDKEKPILEYLRTIYAVEKERSEWIRKYDNVLNGLKYWQSKAKEKNGNTQF